MWTYLIASPYNKMSLYHLTSLSLSVIPRENNGALPLNSSNMSPSAPVSCKTDNTSHMWTRAVFLISVCVVVYGQSNTSSVLFAFQSLYDSTGGWGGNDVCNFFGVSCIPSQNGRIITAVRLQYNNLTNGIPSNWPSAVLQMRSLNLSGNALSSLPPNMNSLNSLQSLDVSGNLLDRVPIMTSCPLLLFSAGNNKISGDVQDILGRLPSTIQSVSLKGNQLKGTVPSLDGLPSLLSLDVSFNAISYIYADLSTSKLSSLNVQYNAISTLPLFPSTLSALIISGNNLALSTSIFLGNVPPQLMQLEASSCGLKGDVSVLPQLLYLRKLDLSLNRVVGQIPSLVSTANLTFLNISNNGITGDLSGISQNNRLQYLDGNNNVLTGTLDPLYNCVNLKYIDLSSNSIGGIIPEFLGNFKSLGYVDLGRNSISGSFPDFIVNLPSLFYLDLMFNVITGGLPEEWGSHLVYLSLAFNQITGTIPEGIYSLGPQLRALILQGNFLTGPITPTITSLTGLTTLYAGGNLLIGSIPSMPSSIQSIVLNLNQFSGDFPASLCQLPQLSFLDISHNAIHSTLPDCLGQMSSLSVLQAAQNQLYGQLPASLSNLSALIDLDLSNNNLEGHISALSDLSQLRILDLSDNYLSGSIDVFASLQNIVSLSMSYNNFSGDIPV
ncbi:putative LRR receptor-like serine/threonine-protein kinase, partial [Planoprotostelium fungivorum]